MSSTCALMFELLWLLFSVEPLFTPVFDAAVGGTLAVGGVTVLDAALATMKYSMVFELNGTKKKQQKIIHKKGEE